MRYILITLAAVAVSLTLTGSLHAQHAGGSKSSGGGGSKPSASSGSKPSTGSKPSSVGTGKPSQGGATKTQGYAYKHRMSNWGARTWNNTYGCWCYWSPEDQCWYYWCAPYGCYYPVSYCPTGKYNYDDPPNN